MSDAKSKNWLLIQLRTWHSWIGVVLSGFIILVCLTGIYLNHKNLFTFGAEKREEKHEEKREGAAADKPSGEKGRGKMREPKPTLLSTATDVTTLSVSLPRAIELARAELGETPLEAVELKTERGRLVYKLKQGEGRELLVDAATGELRRKDEHKEGYKESYQADREDKAGYGGYDWGKIIKDLHTGKIGGDAGKLLTDLVAIMIILLTLSGLYLWAVPKLRKRKAARATAVRNQAAVPSMPPVMASTSRLPAQG